VVSGPSGVGKGTVISTLLRSDLCPPQLVKCTTATTRDPRPGEVDGLNYFFMTPEEFRARIEEGFFLEHATYNGNYYGTPRMAAQRQQESGNDVILEIEVQGGHQVRDAVPDAVLIFLAPPSWEELARRLTGRATEGSETVQRRLEIARKELKAAPHYDYRVVNDDVDTAVDNLRAIILAERCRVHAGK
jgi:guanylate kinase